MTPQEAKREQTRINQLRQEIGQAEANKRTLAPQIAEAKAKVKDLQGQVTEHDRAISKARSEIEKIERSRAKKTSDKVVVTEHAMLRYIERVLGIDLGDLENRILPESSVKSIASLGDGEFPVGDHRIRVKNGHVVTVIV